MKYHLEITIPDYNSFYSLYAEGLHSWKTYDRQKKVNLLYYPVEAVVVLYYTYPTHRQACVIRNNTLGNVVSLPGLSKKVSLLFSVHASRVDKLKRAVGWLDKHSSGALSYDDGFYIRLVFLLEQRGKINYTALSKLAESSSAKNKTNFL